MQIVSLATLTLIVAIALAVPASAQDQAAGVTTDRITSRQVAETVSVFGQIVAGRESDVATRIVGVGAASPLKVGDTVEEGDVLFRLDTRRLNIELEQANAELAIAEAGLSVAKARLDRTLKALERTRSLVSNATVSQAQLDDRNGDYAEALGSLQEAEARITASKAGLSRAQYNVDNSVVRAPFAGTILEISAEVGEFVSAGSVVVRLLGSGELEVEANVPSRFVSALRSGQEVMARTDTGNEMTMTLRAVLPTEFSSTRTRPVRFVPTDDLGGIAVGQTVTLDVPVSRPESVIVVPKDAVVQSGGGWQVFLNDEGKAVPRQVEIGRAIGDAFEVIAGLVEGDEVVVRGNERLRPGQDIAPTPLDADSGTAAGNQAAPSAGANGG
jgi:RND family efflux transporter MFP subunit